MKAFESYNHEWQRSTFFLFLSCDESCALEVGAVLFRCADAMLEVLIFCYVMMAVAGTVVVSQRVRALVVAHAAFHSTDANKLTTADGREAFYDPQYSDSDWVRSFLGLCVDLYQRNQNHDSRSHVQFVN